MNIQTEKNQMPSSRLTTRNWLLALLALVLAFVFALFATPLLASPAAASLDTGKFCIQAVNTEDATINGKGGACKPVAVPEAPKTLTRQYAGLSSQGIPGNTGSHWVNTPWTATASLSNGMTVVTNGVSDSLGQFSTVVGFDYLTTDLNAMSVTFNIGSDSYAWDFPVSAFEYKIEPVVFELQCYYDYYGDEACYEPIYWNWDDIDPYGIKGYGNYANRSDIKWSDATGWSVPAK